MAGVKWTLQLFKEIPNDWEDGNVFTPGAARAFKMK